jgi:hypothetical protein
VFLLLVPFSFVSLGDTFAVFGPEDFIRGTGKPVAQTRTFSVFNPQCAATLRIDNGGLHGQYARVSSAVITLNGVQVVGPSDFNQNVAVIEKPVTLASDNELVVELRSKPGSGITLQIPCKNAPPVADAGPDQTVSVGQLVQLGGSGSTDADGDSLTYTWTLVSKPADSTAELDEPTSAQPTFVVDEPGSYEVQLVVHDGVEDGEPDTVVISTQNSAPAADPGEDQGVFVGQPVQLDGSGSTDADGDELDFQWSFTSVPPGSNAGLSDPTIVDPPLCRIRRGCM